MLILSSFLALLKLPPVGMLILGRAYAVRSGFSTRDNLLFQSG